jgi:NTP pyrophosphatase (non-canonical NTP hydrolase)
LGVKPFDVESERMPRRGGIVFLITDPERVGALVTEALDWSDVAWEITDPARLALLNDRMSPTAVWEKSETPDAPDGRAYTPDAHQRQCLATWGSADQPLREQRIHALLGLVGEAGETADLLKKHFYKPGREATPEQVRDELADVAYYLAVNAHLWGWTLDDLFAHLAGKLAGGHGWTVAEDEN